MAFTSSFPGIAKGRLRRGSSARRLSLTLAISSAVLFAAGCRSDMQDQPKMYPQRGTSLFADGRSVRPQVPGTVARSQGHETDYRSTGLVDGKPGDGLPFPVSTELLARGQERFNIYCSPCHSRVGNGKGAIVDRGYYKAASFHSERLRQAPLGYFFNVITNGFGVMPSYNAEVTIDDRWAIAAYIRALQLSQNAHTADVPSGHASEKLGNVITTEGFPARFLEPWGVTSETAETIPVAPPVAVVPVAAAPVDAKAVLPPTITPATPLTTTKAPVVPGTKAPTTPATVASVTPPAPVVKKGDAAAGKAIYAANCSVCHQPTRAGLPPVFPSLLGIVERTGPQHIRDTLKSGKPDAKPPMPSFLQFSPEDVDNLIEYLRTPK